MRANSSVDLPSTDEETNDITSEEIDECECDDNKTKSNDDKKEDTEDGARSLFNALNTNAHKCLPASARKHICTCNPILQCS